MDGSLSSTIHDSMGATVLNAAGDFVHASAPMVGRFENSETLFNRIHVLIDRAVLSNLASVITDCPHREKSGVIDAKQDGSGLRLRLGSGRYRFSASELQSIAASSR